MPAGVAGDHGVVSEESDGLSKEEEERDGGGQQRIGLQYMRMPTQAANIPGTHADLRAAPS